MASNEAKGESSEPAGEPEGVDDALGRLEQRLDRASEAAERLLADAAKRVTSKPPPAGWQRTAPNGDDGAADGDSLLGGEAELLIGIAHPDFRAELKLWAAGVRHYLL